MPPRPRFQEKPAAYLLAACMLLALAQWVSKNNLDGYFDMLESYAWGQTMPLGTFKHPPFFAWVAHGWFVVAPRNVLSFFVLSYLNVFAGLLGVAYLADKAGMGRLKWLAAAMLVLAFPYSTLAAKFNANSQLLALWPWAAACMLASWQTASARSKDVAWAVALGLVSAAAMLTKYYSGVFLLGLLLAALLHPQGRQWLMGWRPYLALVVCVLALWPHIQWQMQHGMQTIQYVGEQGSGHVNVRTLLKFVFAPVFYWVIPWLFVLLFTKKWGNAHGQGVWRMALESWRPHGVHDTVFWLAFFPWAITLAFGISAFVELSTPWAIPIGYAFSILWLRNLSAYWDDAAVARLLQQWERFFIGALALVSVGAVALAVVYSYRAHPSYYRPDAEAARAVLQSWHQKHPDKPLQWTGGDWANNAVMAFYGDPRIRVFPGVPDEAPALVDPHRPWAHENGIFLCALGVQNTQPDAQPDAAAELARSSRSACELQIETWAQKKGLHLDRYRITAGRTGWPFAASLPFGYAIYHYVP